MLDPVAPEFEIMIDAPATQQVSVAHADFEIDTMPATIHLAPMALPVASKQSQQDRAGITTEDECRDATEHTEGKKKRTSAPRGTFDPNGTPSLSTFKRMWEKTRPNLRVMPGSTCFCSICKDAIVTQQTCMRCICSILSKVNQTMLTEHGAVRIITKQTLQPLDDEQKTTILSKARQYTEVRNKILQHLQRHYERFQLKKALQKRDKLEWEVCT